MSIHCTKLGRRRVPSPQSLILPLLILSLAFGLNAALPILAVADKQGIEPFAIDLTASEADVLKAVKAVVQDEVVHGTQMYEKEETLYGAVEETGSTFFGPYTGPGHAFFKIRRDALAPRHFKNSADIGIISVRYVVEPVAPTRTHLEITAVFVEDGTNHIHLSDTSVETSEFAEIQAHVVAIQREEQQAAEILQKRALSAEAATIAKQRNDEAARIREVAASIQGLQQRADQLQHALEVRVANVNTELKAAPFHSAQTMTLLSAGTDVLVEIITEHWYGVETQDGHRGWLRRDQVAPIP
jgi:hypothetical protein